MEGPGSVQNTNGSGIRIQDAQKHTDPPDPEHWFSVKLPKVDSKGTVYGGYGAGTVWPYIVYSVV